MNKAFIIMTPLAANPRAQIILGAACRGLAVVPEGETIVARCFNARLGRRAGTQENLCDSIVPSGIHRARQGFTLVELLVVIAIIGLLAALIVGGAGIATAKARTARVQTERDALVTAIEDYKAHKGFYPPDNTNNPALSPLFYELTGITNVNGNFISVSQESLNPTDVANLFGIPGFINVATDQPAQNFFRSAGKTTRTASFYVSGKSGKTFTLFAVPVPPGTKITPTQVGGAPANLWHYVSTNPSNNPNEFDLWMDVAWGGKTNRISNWSKDPQVVTH